MIFLRIGTRLGPRGENGRRVINMSPQLNPEELKKEIMCVLKREFELPKKCRDKPFLDAVVFAASKEMVESLGKPGSKEGEIIACRIVPRRLNKTGHENLFGLMRQIWYGEELK
jgi:hypothetical protein